MSARTRTWPSSTSNPRGEPPDGRERCDREEPPERGGPLPLLEQLRDRCRGARLRRRRRGDTRRRARSRRRWPRRSPRARPWRSPSPAPRDGARAGDARGTAARSDDAAGSRGTAGRSPSAPSTSSARPARLRGRTRRAAVTGRGHTPEPPTVAMQTCSWGARPAPRGSIRRARPRGHGTRRARPADTPGAPDRPPARGRPNDTRGGGLDVPESQDDRVPPAERLPQARCPLPSGALGRSGAPPPEPSTGFYAPTFSLNVVRAS
jgi:hypothetical protein